MSSVTSQPSLGRSVRFSAMSPPVGTEIARLDCLGLPHKSVHVTSGGAATLTLQVSQDDVAWHAVETFVLGAGGSAFASPAAVSAMSGYRFVRVVTQSAVAGAVTAEISAI